MHGWMDGWIDRWMDGWMVLVHRRSATAFGLHASNCIACRLSLVPALLPIQIWTTDDRPTNTEHTDTDTLYSIALLLRLLRQQHAHCTNIYVHLTHTHTYARMDPRECIHTHTHIRRRSVVFVGMSDATASKIQSWMKIRRYGPNSKFLTARKFVF